MDRQEAEKIMEKELDRVKSLFTAVLFWFENNNKVRCNFCGNIEDRTKMFRRVGSYKEDLDGWYCNRLEYDAHRDRMTHQ